MKCEKQEKVIKRYEAIEKIKDSIVNETSEERMRNILEKYVVRPRIIQSQEKFINLYDRKETGSEYIYQMELTLKSTTLFLSNNLEQIK